jgi:glycosyltransferase involved in cell wall biosynthesis
MSALELLRPVPRDSTSNGPPVLFVAFQSGAHANGGLQSLTEILRRLRRVRPILLTQIESPVTERWRSLGYEVHIWPVPWPRSALAQRRARVRRMAGDILPLLMGNLRMLSLLHSRGIRVVHCNDAWASLIAAPSARLAGARVVLNIRDTLLVDVRRWSLMCALSDRVIVLSEEMRQIVLQQLAPPPWLRGKGATPIDAVYSVVDPALMRPASRDERCALRAELGIPPGEIAVGVIGALMPKKQQLQLLQYLAQSPERLPPAVKLYFVGDFTPETDSYSKNCQEAAEQSPLRERICFAGYSREIERWYRALDMTLMVSRFEGLARGMIESIACGTPVVAFDFCSAREILEQYACGLVAKQGDFAGLMQHLGRLAREPELRQRLGDNGPPIAREHFAPDRIAARYEDIYLELRAAREPDAA